MRKLFSGRIGRIPVAVLVISLLAVMVAGGVVAATGGYVLWEGSAEITVNEPIHVYWGSSEGSYPHELDLGDADPLGASVGMVPGVCMSTYFKITSDTAYDLLVKAIYSSSNSTVVAVTFNVTDIDTTGVVVNNSSPLLVTRTVCVDGAAELGVYTALTGFTRESAP